MKSGPLPAFFYLRRAVETSGQKSIIDRVTLLVQPILEECGVELFEIQFRQEGHGWVLRLIIDSETGISLDHCTEVSREAGNLLEIEEVITHPYHLEVSSPGIDRPLRNEADFTRFAGRLAKIKVAEPVDGHHVFVGRIGSMDKGVVELIVEKESIRIPLDRITKARLEIEF